MKRRKLTWVVLGAATLLVTYFILASPPSPSKFVGVYEGLGDWKSFGANNDLIAKNLASVRLNLKPDDNFELTNGGMPSSGVFRTAKSGGRVEIVLDVRFILNRPLESQAESLRTELQNVRLMVDGDSIVFTDSAVHRAGTRLRRVNP